MSARIYELAKFVHEQQWAAEKKYSVSKRQFLEYWQLPTREKDALNMLAEKIIDYFEALHK